MAPIVQVQHVFKKYSRNANIHLGYGMRDLFDHLLGRKPSLELRKDEFFAVNDVSFELEQGDTLALIGRNGSGKSTLLKMMNGIVKPDAGRIVMEGRVQALINLGAGFNPALSGLDNIYNAAALHGFNRKETRAIVDEIVDFSELEEFITSPIETYSSGMKARLGFAVAAHLKPDILLIDEILAVGDHAFQNKCYARLEVLKAQKVTVVFVSHSQSAVIKLCREAIWLHKGRIMAIGPSRNTVEAYNDFLEMQEKEKLSRQKSAKSTTTKGYQQQRSDKTKTDLKSEKTLYGPIHPETDYVDEIACELFVEGLETDVIGIHSEVVIRVSFTLRRHVQHLFSTLNFYRKDGLLVAAIATAEDDRFANIHSGHLVYEVHIPDFDFCPGHYVIVMPIADGQHYLWRDIVKEFFVESGGRRCVGIKHIQHKYSIWVDGAKVDCTPSAISENNFIQQHFGDTTSWD